MEGWKAEPGVAKANNMPSMENVFTRESLQYLYIGI